MTMVLNSTFDKLQHNVEVLEEYSEKIFQHDTFLAGKLDKCLHNIKYVLENKTLTKKQRGTTIIYNIEDMEEITDSIYDFDATMALKMIKEMSIIKNAVE